MQNIFEIELRLKEENVVVINWLLPGKKESKWQKNAEYEKGKRKTSQQFCVLPFPPLKNNKHFRMLS